MINVLFAGNSGVFDGMLTCMLSILKRNRGKEPFTFYVFTMDVSHIKPSYTRVTQADAEFLQDIAKRYDADNRVIRCDVTDLYMRELGGCPNESAYCSPYTLVRLLADLVDGMPDKLLYLDADIMFNRDIHLLYDIDIEDCEYAAARDHYGKYLLYPNYINAGVLLMNMKKMRGNHVMEKARGFLREKKMLFADQSALIKSTSKKKLLPQRFNDQKFLHKHTVVRHFSKRLFWLPYPHTDNIKQWHVAKVHKIFGYYCFDDILFDYIYYKKTYENQTKEETSNG